MSTYRIITVSKQTLYVHNVTRCSPEYDSSEDTPTALVFYRAGAAPVTFPWINVASYEATT
jgi:hypothetical protein